MRSVTTKRTGRDRALNACVEHGFGVGGLTGQERPGPPPRAAGARRRPSRTRGRRPAGAPRTLRGPGGPRPRRPLRRPRRAARSQSRQPPRPRAGRAGRTRPCGVNTRRFRFMRSIRTKGAGWNRKLNAKASRMTWAPGSSRARQLCAALLAALGRPLLRAPERVRARLARRRVRRRKRVRAGTREARGGVMLRAALCGAEDARGGAARGRERVVPRARRIRVAGGAAVGLGAWKGDCRRRSRHEHGRVRPDAGRRARRQLERVEDPLQPGSSPVSRCPPARNRPALRVRCRAGCGGVLVWGEGRWPGRRWRR
jgi:hypothetical protein